jgi:hypothetical protein
MQHLFFLIGVILLSGFVGEGQRVSVKSISQTEIGISGKSERKQIVRYAPVEKHQSLKIVARQFFILFQYNQKVSTRLKIASRKFNSIKEKVKYLVRTTPNQQLDEFFSVVV